MTLRGVVGASLTAALLVGGVACSHDGVEPAPAGSPGALVIEDTSGDTWHTRRNGSYEPSAVTANVDLVRATVSYTPKRLSFVLVYAEPLDPGLGAFGAQVGLAFSESTDNEMVVDWSSDRPDQGEALSATAGPEPLCHPTASPDFGAGIVTIVVPVGQHCLPRHPQPQRLLVRRAASWADGELLDSIFTRDAFARGDAWVELTDGQ
jgi:hypothetical protein